MEPNWGLLAQSTAGPSTTAWAAAEGLHRSSNSFSKEVGIEHVPSRGLLRRGGRTPEQAGGGAQAAVFLRMGADGRGRGHSGGPNRSSVEQRDPLV